MGDDVGRRPEGPGWYVPDPTKLDDEAREMLSIMWSAGPVEFRHRCIVTVSGLQVVGEGCTLGDAIRSAWRRGKEARNE